MEIFIKAAQLIASLSILIVLHECGHFFAARYFNTRVEKFYLFFNPWFSLFKVKRGETEYGLGWLPLGGYVKIAGMIDESMDTEALSKPPQPWEFRSKPAWQRLIIMIGGVVVNLILGFLIYAMILFTWGDLQLQTKNLTDGVWIMNPVAEQIGFQNGDKLISLNGEDFNYLGDVTNELLFGGDVTIERNGSKQIITIPEDLPGMLSEGERAPFFYPRIPFVIKKVPGGSPNESSGYQAFDQVMAVNGERITYRDEVAPLLEKYSGQNIPVTVKRGEEERDIATQVTDSATIGVQIVFPEYKDMAKAGLYEFDRKEYSLLESIPGGFNKAADKLGAYVRQFKLIFNPSTGAYKSVGGFGAIGSMFPPTWEWESFWEITAILSLILAFMNILPIPALDGGHVLFLLYEMIVGKAPSQKFLERAQMVGFFILLALLLFANGNDIYRAIFK